MNIRNLIYLAAGVWLLLKMIVMALGFSEEGFVPGIMLNLLFLLLLIFFSIPNQSEESFFEDVKTALRTGVLYTVLIALSVYVYYAWIDPDFMKARIEQNMQLAQDEFPTEESFQTFRSENPNLREENREDYLKELRSKLERFIYAPFAQTSYTLLSLLMTAIMYSILLVFFKRKVLGQLKL